MRIPRTLAAALLLGSLLPPAVSGLDAPPDRDCGAPQLRGDAKERPGKASDGKEEPCRPPRAERKSDGARPGWTKSAGRAVSGANIQAAAKAVSAPSAEQESRLEKLFSGAEWSDQAGAGPVMAALPAPAGQRAAESEAAEAFATNPAPGATVKIARNVPPAPDSPEARLKSRGPMYRLVRVFDGFENACIRTVIKTPPLKSLFLKLLGAEKAELYRGVSAGEMRNLAASGWRYDLTDKRNLFKFTTPDKDMAMAYARKHRGYLIKIESEQAVPYYKLSRFWNPSTSSKLAKEHLVLLDGSERIALVADRPSGSHPER